MTAAPRPPDVLLHLVGVAPELMPPEWPRGWPPPRLGERIVLPDSPYPLIVRNVEWLPVGDATSVYPRVVVVVGPPPPRVMHR